MHIILGILAALTTGYFALRRLSFMANEVEGATGILARIRRFFWRGGPAHPLSQVTDVPEAVASILVAMANAKGALNEKQIKEIKSILEDDLGVAFHQTDELMALARFNVKDQNDPGMIISRLKPMLNDTTNEAQRIDLLRMMKQVGEVDGEMVSLQDLALTSLASHFRLSVPS